MARDRSARPVAGGVPRAVLLDALGTLVELVPPWPALARELGRRGVRVTEDEARRAMLAEMAYYRAHLDEARDGPSLAALRGRCAAVLADALPRAARVLGEDELLGALLGALEFRPYPEVGRVLARWRAGGARLVVVSNWDVSLHEVLDRTGLAVLVDGAVSSAEHGAAKPAASIFAAALDLAGGVPAEDAVHVGDSVEADVAGARAAGLRAVLVARGAPPRVVPGVPVAASLDDVGF